MTIDDMVEKLFAENPDLSEDEAVKRLKEMKDPKTDKPMWRAGTIHHSIDNYLRKKRGEPRAVHTESPVETKGSGSNLKVEGKDIRQHGPGPTTGPTKEKDPFAIKPDGNVEDKVDQMKEIKTALADEQVFKKGIIDDISKKVLEQVSKDAKSFRDEAVSIFSDFVSDVRVEFTNVKKEISNLRTQGLPAYEPVVKYDNLELRESTIGAIQKNREEKELKEDSDYIDNLIKNEEECTSGLRVYRKLIDLAKEAKNGVLLRLFYENDKLSYDKKSVGRFGINHLIGVIAIGIAIGMGIGIWLTTALTEVPPPIP